MGFHQWLLPPPPPPPYTQRASNGGSVSIPLCHHPRFCYASFLCGYINKSAFTCLLYQHITMMSQWASEIIGNSTLCSTICLGWLRTKQPSLRHWPSVRGIHWSPVDSPYKMTSYAEIGSMTSWSFWAVSPQGWYIMYPIVFIVMILTKSLAITPIASLKTSFKLGLLSKLIKHYFIENGVTWRYGHILLVKMVVIILILLNTVKIFICFFFMQYPSEPFRILQYAEFSHDYDCG